MVQVILALADTAAHRAIISRLASWSKNQLVRDFLVCWSEAAAHPRFERVSAGEASGTTLAAEVSNDHRLLLVVVAAWQTETETETVGLVTRALHAQDNLLSILAAGQMDVREPVVVLVPPSLKASVPTGCLKEGHRTFILAPEEREGPGGTNHLVEDPSLLPSHSAAAIAGLTGLWVGTEGFVVPLAVDDPHVANGQFARSVTSYTRIVDVGFLIDHVAQGALASPHGWPNPSPADFDSVPADPRLLGDLTRTFLDKHREALGSTVIELFPEERPPLISLFQAWTRFLRELWEMIKLKPAQMVEQVVRRAYDTASELTEKATGYKVDRWDDPEEPLRVIEARRESRYQAADGGVAEVWTDLKRLCIGMIDGSKIPDFVSPGRVTVAGGRRVLVLDPHGYVPDPRTRPPLPEVRVCDVRALDAALATDGVDQKTHPEQAAYVAERRNTIVWRVGVAIADAIATATAELTSAEREASDLKRLVEEEREQTEKRAGKLARAASRFIATAMLLALAGIAGAIVVAQRTELTATALSSVGLLVLWLAIVTRLGWRLVRMRRRLHDQLTSKIARLGALTVTISARGPDRERLERRYDEFMDWSEVLGWLLHAPWSPPDPDDSRVKVDREISLPPSVQRAVGHVETSTLAALQAAAIASIFPPSWLQEIEGYQLDHAMRSYLAIREQVTDADAEGRPLPDPYGDTRKGDGTPRQFFASTVKDDARRRRLGSRALEAIEERVRRDWPIGKLVDGVADNDPGNDLTAPRPGWVSEPAVLRQMARRIRPSVARLHRDGAGGSGVVIGPGRLLTNAHVVGHRTGEIEVLLDGRAEPMAGRVERVSDVTDLALVTFDAAQADVAAIPLAATRPEQGDAVFTLGHPLLLEGDPTLSWGYVSAPQRTITLDRDDGSSWDLDVLQCTYASAGGASGSGVFDGSGRLVGVHCAGRVRDQRADDFMSFSVPVDVIQAFLAEDGESGTLVAPASDHAWELSRVESLQDFLDELSVKVGDLVFGTDGPWRAGTPVRAADLVYGADQLEVGTSKIEATHGSFTVFVRTVVVMSARHAKSELR